MSKDKDMSKLRRSRFQIFDSWPRPRRFSLLNLLCLFLFLTVLLTAYMHGLIEVDSSRVVINIASAAQNARNMQRIKDLEHRQSSESFLQKNVNFDNEFKKSRERDDEEEPRRGRYDLKQQHEHEDNINQIRFPLNSDNDNDNDVKKTTRKHNKRKKSAEK